MIQKISYIFIFNDVLSIDNIHVFIPCVKYYLSILQCNVKMRLQNINLLLNEQVVRIQAVNMIRVTV